MGQGGLLSAKGNSLSEGETQRIALARLLVQQPKRLLLDEPTAACDIQATQSIEEPLERWQGTLIFTTHAPAQAARLANRVLFLHQGKLVEDRPATKALFSPNSIEMQQFLQYWRF